MRNISRNITALALPLVLLTPALHATEPTPWDTMRGTYSGDATVVMKTGKKLKGSDTVIFTPDAVTIAGTKVPRQDVKEVVSRRHRDPCCDVLALGLAPLAGSVEGIVQHDIPKDEIPIFIIDSPAIIGMAAVTGPPLLIIEGVRRLKPAKILYKVIP